MERFKELKLRHELFLAILVGILIGVILFSFTLLSSVALIVTVLCALLFIKDSKTGIIFGVMFVIGLMLGGVRFLLWQDAFVGDFDECKVANIEGVVVGRPYRSNFNNVFYVKPKAALCLGQSIDTRTILVRSELNESIARGDEVILSGRLSLPDTFMTDSGVPFDYARYLSSKNVSHILRDVLVIKRTESTNIMKYFDIANSYLISKLHDVIRDPSGGLAGGVLLGDKRGVTERLSESMKRSGLIHIAVLSGYNISLASEYARKIIAVIAPSFGVVGGFIAIICYGLIAGLEPPVIRAIVMAGIAILGLSTGRMYMAIKALLFVATIFALMSPASVLFDPSFHLSFLATLGIITLTPIFETWYIRYFKNATIVELLSTTTAAYISVTPYMAVTMGTISLIAPLANLIVAPLVPLSMLLSFIALIASFIPGLGMIVGMLAEVPLGIIVAVAEWAGGIGWSSMAIGLRGIVALTFYVLLTIIAIRFYRKHKSTTHSLLQEAFQNGVDITDEKTE